MTQSTQAQKPLLRAGAGKAHKAKGTPVPRTAEGMAAFLRLTERK